MDWGKPARHLPESGGIPGQKQLPGGGKDHFTARNKAPTVYGDVLTPVVPRYATAEKPASAMSFS